MRCVPRAVAGVVSLAAVWLLGASNDDLQSILDNRVTETRQAVGIVAATIDPEGRRVYQAGRARLAGGSELNGDTLFEIGSITKVFTSLVLADMIVKGEVKPDDPVAKYLPEGAIVPSRNGKQITLLNLSMQDSGLPRLPNNLQPADLQNPYADYDGPKLLGYLATYHLFRDPGEKYEYSNLGVGLLGFALANRAGVSYEELVRGRVLRPLRMDHTTISLSPEQKSHLAEGHSAELKPVKNWDFAALAGAGALRSTANDLLRFLAANLGLVDSPLKPAMERMRSIRRDTDIPDTQIAMAWHVTNGQGSEIFWHNGGTAGYRSYIGLDLAAKRAVVVLSNTFYDGVDGIGKHALNPRYPLPLDKPRTEIELDPNVLNDFAGKYQLAPTFAITLTVRDGHLFAEATGQPEFQVFASGKDEFFYKVVDAQLHFERDATGKVIALVLHQNGQEIRGARVP